MPRRRKGLFARIADAITAFWQAISEPEPESKRAQKRYEKGASPKRARRPLPPRPFGVPEPPARVPRPEPIAQPQQPEDIWDHGDYPPQWSQLQRDLWDAEPMTYRAYYTDTEWTQLQEAFNYGWFHAREGMTKADHDEWRDRFYDLTGMTESSFDWNAYREYVNAEFGYQ